MNEMRKYDDAVQIIKAAILQSQYDAARAVNEKQLMLYYGVGKYISLNSRQGFWGKGAIDTISERLQKELPGLRGFSARSLRDMRIFYEEWSMFDKSSIGDSQNVLAVATAKIENEFADWKIRSTYANNGGIGLARQPRRARPNGRGCRGYRRRCRASVGARSLAHQ